MLIEMLIGLGVLLVILIAFIATRPAEFQVERSTIISAPPEAVFGRVNNFHEWEAWSPWAKRDPNMKTTYEGPDAGKGATYAWNGNKDVGQGKMTLTESRPNELIRIRLEFLKPFKATNTTEFAFRAEGDGTRLTWSMTGTNNFVAKAMSLFMNMDKMVGGDFESGLAGIKAITENAS